MNDPDFPFAAEIAEIADCAEVNICGIIPLHGESPCNGHISESDLDSCTPISDIDETDDSPFSDPEHFFQDNIRAFDGLECLAQNHIIIGIIFEIAEAVIEVCLNDGDTASDTFDDFFLIHFHAHDSGIFEDLHCFEESSCSAPEIQDSGVFRDHFCHCA